MKRLDGYRTRMVLFGIMIAMVVGSGRAKADFTFGEPTNLGPTVNTSAGESPSFITADGLVMYWDCYNRPGGYGGWDIWVATRETTADDWGDPVNVGAPVNTSRDEFCACLSADGQELYFGAANWPGGYGSDDIWMTTRQTSEQNPEGNWSTPINLGATVNSSSYDFGPRISSDGLEIYFNSERSGGYGSDDIWVSSRATKDDPWGEPTNLGPAVNTSASECYPFLSSDGLALFFSGERFNPIRPGGYGSADMWMTKRVSASDPWGTPVNLGSVVNSTQADGGPVISPDGSTIYFGSERPGGLGGLYGDIYQAPIIPIVDLNADRIVDAVDMCIMIDLWGTDDPLCDIGPMPWGDGVVDVEDLIVLAEHLFERLPGRSIAP